MCAWTSAAATQETRALQAATGQGVRVTTHQGRGGEQHQVLGDAILGASAITDGKLLTEHTVCLSGARTQGGHCLGYRSHCVPWAPGPVLSRGCLEATTRWAEVSRRGRRQSHEIC